MRLYRHLNPPSRLEAGQLVSSVSDESFEPSRAAGRSDAVAVDLPAARGGEDTFLGRPSWLTYNRRYPQICHL